MGQHEKKKQQEYRNRVKCSKRQIKKREKKEREKNHRCVCTSMLCPDGNTSYSSSIVRPRWTFESVSESEHDRLPKKESISDSSKTETKDQSISDGYRR